MRLQLRHLFAAAAASASASASAGSSSTATNDSSKKRSVRRVLSQTDIDRQLAGARRLQLEDEDQIKGISLFEFADIFDSDAFVEFGVEEAAERARELWDAYAVWDYALAVEMETKFYLGDEDTELSDILYGYLICSEVPNETARQRKEDIFKILEVNLPNFQVDITFDFIFEDVLRALQTVYNDDERTCFIGNMRASVVAVITALDNVKILPLNSYSKMRSGVVEELLKRAYPEEWAEQQDQGQDQDDGGDDGGAQGEGNQTDQGQGRRRAQDGDGGTGGDNPEGSGLTDEEGLTVIDEEEKPGVSQDDISSDAKVEDDDSSLDVVMCPGVPVEELNRLGDKIRTFMLRRDPNGRNYASTLTPYFGKSDAELADLPVRVRFWRRVFEVGIDSDAGCGSTIDRITAIVTEAEEAGDPAGVSMRLSEAGEGEQYDTDVACIFGLIFSLSLFPQVCSVELSKKNYAFNVEAQSIVQGGGGGSSGTRPFWDAGITGDGQVVAVSDTGLDWDHCHFLDSLIPMNANGGYDMNRRKVVQYDPYIDAKDDEGGHGTHVAGTIVGHKAEDGVTETEGDANGVAKDAKVAFIDCSSGGSGLSIPGDKNRLLNTGTEAGARIHSASWGATLNPYRYDTMARDIDSYLASNWDMLMLVAAGNSGRINNPKSLGSPATSKNVLAIGAGQSAGDDLTQSQRGYDYIADFSSEGPTSDGRIAPQLVGPGQSILSSNAIPTENGECEPLFPPTGGSGTNWGLTYKAGTSMATPAVAGAAALVRQYFLDGFYPSGIRNATKEASVDPSGTLVKAVLINGGQVMTGKDNGIALGVQPSTMYDNVQGFGRVSLIDSLRLNGKNDINVRAVDRVTVPDGNRRGYQVLINATVCQGKELRATLVYADPAGASGCVSCLVNDLDLTLENEQTGEIYYPNGKNAKDSVNNIERIIVPANKLLSGDSWMATVTAANLDRAEQQFSLVMSGCFSFDGMGDIGLKQPGSANGIGSWLAASFALLTSTYFLMAHVF